MRNLLIISFMILLLFITSTCTVNRRSSRLLQNFKDILRAKFLALTPMMETERQQCEDGGGTQKEKHPCFIHLLF